MIDMIDSMFLDVVLPHPGSPNVRLKSPPVSVEGDRRSHISHLQSRERIQLEDRSGWTTINHMLKNLMVKHISWLWHTEHTIHLCNLFNVAMSIFELSLHVMWHPIENTQQHFSPRQPMSFKPWPSHLREIPPQRLYA